MSQLSFNEFGISSKNDWTAQANKDLKGKDFSETLLWNTNENFVVEPFYAEEDLTTLPLAEIQAAQSTKTQQGWQNRPVVKFDTEKSTNTLIISILQKGTNGVILDLSHVDIQQISLVKLLDNIKLSESPIVFKTNNQATILVTELNKFINYQMKGGIQDDVLAAWNKTGEWNSSAWENTKSLLDATKNSPTFRPITIGSHHFHQAGANATQELGFLLASTCTYLDALTDLGVSVDEVFAKTEFSVSVGTNYFVEIAKIRALRVLLVKLYQTFTESTALPKIFIDAQTSTYYDAAITINTNILRATTEAMSAAVGGCDSLTVHAHNAVAGLADEFSERIARNISVLMKEESHLDKSNDAAAGSYYIENLTTQLVKEAWGLFLKVEEMGGFQQAFTNGFVANEVNESYQKQLAQLQNGKVMVGVNKFRFDEQEFSKPNEEPSTSQLPNRRISESFEL